MQKHQLFIVSGTKRYVNLNIRIFWNHVKPIVKLTVFYKFEYPYPTSDTACFLQAQYILFFEMLVPYLHIFGPCLE